MNTEFPTIAIQGEGVIAKNHIAKGTGTAVFGAFFVAILGTLIGIIFSYGVLLVVLLFYPLIAHFINKKALATIHGSGILVSEEQFPEIQECVDTFASRLGIQKSISVYIVEESIMNAAAVKYGKKNVILLTDRLIQGALESGEPRALSFVLAHELAHISLKHTGLFRSWMSGHMKLLGRLDEYSADAVAAALVEEKTIAYNGLLMLTIGYALLPYVDAESVVQQAEEVANDKYSKRAEKTLTHPLLLNRLYKILST